MTKFESDVKTIDASQSAVYTMLSNPSNIERVRSVIPEDKVKNISYNEDSISIEVEPIGKVTMQIVEREPEKLIKFEAQGAPLPVNLWIQILPTGEKTSKLRVTLGLEVNTFMKAMIQKPAQEGVNKAAEMLSLIQYS
ncbi:MAG: SRPBCC family protein [Bacteroidales bacterium]|nr:SRPBCC family protein [Bacteroidales bacterium]